MTCPRSHCLSNRAPAPRAPDQGSGTVHGRARHSKSWRYSQRGDCEFHLLWQEDTLTTRSGAPVFGMFCPLAIEDGVLYSLRRAFWLTCVPWSVLGCRANGPLLQGSALGPAPLIASAVLGVHLESVSLNWSGQCPLPPGPGPPTM